MSGEAPKTVADLMTREVATLQRNDRLDLAEDVMKLGRVRHLPILDEDGLLVGIISQRDLLHGALAEALGYGRVAQQKVMKTLYVKEIMTTEPVTVTPDTPIDEAARLMVRHKLGCLPVVEAERLVGILTEGDFVAIHARQERHP
jgi:CBS domain-containing protein